MRMVLIACRPYWLVMLIVALLQVCAMAEGPPSSSEGVLRSMPPLSQSGTVVRPRARSTIPRPDGDTRASAVSEFARRPPQVRSFALLPEPDEHMAKLRIEFAKDARLPREFDVQLDKARVPLNLDAGNVATTRIKFDVDSFLQEQEARAEFARRGALVPIFRGRHFKGFE